MGIFDCYYNATFVYRMGIFDRYYNAAFVYSGSNRAIQPLMVDKTFVGTAHIWTMFGIFYYCTNRSYEEILNDLNNVLEISKDIIPKREQSIIVDAVTDELIPYPGCARQPLVLDDDAPKR